MINYQLSWCDGEKASVWQRSEACREGLTNCCFVRWLIIEVGFFWVAHNR